MKITVWESIRLGSSWRTLVGQEAGGPPGFPGHTRDVALPEPGPPVRPRHTFSPGPQYPALQGGRRDHTVPQARLPLSCPVCEAEYPAVQGGVPGRGPAPRPHAADGRGPVRGLRPSTPAGRLALPASGRATGTPGWRSRGPALSHRTRAQVPGPPASPCPDVRPQLVSVSSLHAFGWHPSGVTAPPPALRSPPAQRVLEKRQGHGTDRRAFSLPGPVSPRSQSPPGQRQACCASVSPGSLPTPPRHGIRWVREGVSPAYRRMDRQTDRGSDGWRVDCKAGESQQSREAKPSWFLLWLLLI